MLSSTLFFLGPPLALIGSATTGAGAGKRAVSPSGHVAGLL
jgi:hypothetical protein